MRRYALMRSRPSGRLPVYITFLIPSTGETAVQLERTPRNVGYDRSEDIRSGLHWPR